MCLIERRQWPTNQCILLGDPADLPDNSTGWDSSVLGCLNTSGTPLATLTLTLTPSSFWLLFSRAHVPLAFTALLSPTSNSGVSRRENWLLSSPVSLSVRIYRLLLDFAIEKGGGIDLCVTSLAAHCILSSCRCCSRLFTLLVVVFVLVSLCRHLCISGSSTSACNVRSGGGVCGRCVLPMAQSTA